MKKISFILILHFMALIVLSGCGNNQSANQISDQPTANVANTNAIEAQTDVKEIDISDICELTGAKLVGNGKEFICNDTKALETLENIFEISESITETSCPFDECALYITKKDGTTGIIYPASDSCNVIKTSSGYYTYGDETAGYDNSSKFWALFDISDPHTTFHA